VLLEIGRNSQNDLVLVDSSVSQRHAQITRTDNIFVLRDLGSTNGTFVNRERVASHRLVDGDDIHFGVVHCYWRGQSIFDGTDRNRLLATLNESPGPAPAQSAGSPRGFQKFAVAGFVAVIGALAVGLFALRWYNSGDTAEVASVATTMEVAVVGRTADDLAQSTVYIEVSDTTGEACWSGSGAIVGLGQYVLTNAHVAAPSLKQGPQYQDCTNIAVGITESANEKPSLFLDASIVDIDKSLDLALLQLDGVAKNLYPSFNVSTTNMNLDDPVRIIGYPGTGGDTVTLTNGVIAGYDNNGSAQFYKVSAKISHGNSGGPMVDSKGNLVGIATAGYPAGVECNKDYQCVLLDESIGLVRPIRYAVALLALIK